MNRDDLPTWISVGPEHAPRQKRRSGLFEPIGNIVGAILFFVGLALFVGAMHYLPDPSDLERRVEQRMEMMP